MVAAYLDTSAAVKLVVQEAGSDAMEQLIWDETRVLVSSWLLHTELHCAVVRRDGMSLALVEAVLGMTRLAELQRPDLVAGAGLERLRANDAIHLATAVRLGVDEMITYDAELAAAAARLGLRVVTPGT